MNDLLQRIAQIFQSMTPGRRIALVVVLAGLVAAFAAMFFWAGTPEYQVLFSQLSQEDAGKIVSKLQEQRIPYQLAQGGTAVLVPGEQVYELRLSLAAEGLPKGGSVGFEIFDESSFSTTEFVQKLNYQRALQGELSRTIGQFNEVRSAKVLIVPAKDTVFVETTSPATASVLLDLVRPLSSGQVSGIVNLVANAVEGLGTEQVTVVDTTGKVWFKGAGEGDDAALAANNRLEMQQQTEDRLAKHVQSMLEQIVGPGKAIVRVRAEMDFDQEEYSEETYDPDSVVVRSQQKRTEDTVKETPGGATVNTMNNQPGMASGAALGQSRTQKQDEVTNNEINRVQRRVTKVLPTITRLSVAAVLDGTYKTVENQDGVSTAQFVPRTAEELKQFEGIVKNAMGYSEDREDQVTVSSFQFTSLPGADMAAAEAPSAITKYLNMYGKWALLTLLMLLTFVFVVRPILKSVKPPEPEKEETQALEHQEMALLPEAPEEIDISLRARQLALDEFEKAEQLVRGWLGEVEQ
ncbi:flagellar basal-body MS-ring/collar protein FliF [Desulfatibacillum aliphaticivorans]|uniref:Flagellar M-ring protein n=1 Tax=Desulfatibacillum aliphaticivorans TaxID=218208 RepID=B8FJU4_DESAL|nr:flagellar basal-body MS-ring/collar protein FliF [Desulfatibacillum aliphaticivorans]ACL02372.1 Flagellar M-ring protein FliF [Desulfatibacillum aliphaticivorans]